MEVDESGMVDEVHFWEFGWHLELISIGYDLEAA